MNKKIIGRYCFRETLGLIIMGAALFWGAGTLNWWQGWAALGVMTLWTIGMAAVILRINPSLLAERLGPRKGAKAWDAAILSALGLIQLGRYIVAGLDWRFGWSGEFPLSVQMGGLILSILGNALVVWATASNAFFSQVVRIQTEREHQVATGGPYHFVRHPAYAGVIIFEMAVAFLLSSWWALLPGVVNVILMILRTVLEDRALKVELPGYADYACQTRYRLIPGIW